MADLPGYAPLPADTPLDNTANSPPGFRALPSEAKIDAPVAPYSGSFLPISSDTQGKIHFDPHAGILGNIIQAFKAPGDAAAGKFDPLSPEGNRRALDLATLISPVNPAIRAGDYAIPGLLKNLRQAKPPAPTVEALKDAASTGYDAARATGATYPGEAVSGAAQDTVNALNADGFIATNAPKTHAILQGLSNPEPGAFATITGLDSARRSLGKIAGDPTDMAAASRAIHAIDDFVQKSGEAPPVAGAATGTNLATTNGAGAGGAAAASGATPESQAARLIQDARGNSAAAFRSDRISGVEDAAELRAAAANSGQNVGNALRQRLASLLLNPKASRGFSADELDSIRQVVQGTATSNTLRKVGNTLGGGGGLGHTMVGTLGAVGGGLLGGVEGAGIGAAALPMVGSAARHAYNSAVQRAIENVAQSVRMRSPLYNQRLAAAPNVPGKYTGQSLLGRAPLMGGLLGPQQQ